LDGQVKRVIIITNRNIEILKTIIQAGAKIDVKDDEGKTALMLAEEFRIREAIEILSAAGTKTK
jgi:ankyrin repeat protein